MKKEHIVVFTGAGMSAPSGLATFRDPDGIWSRYRVEEVATPEAWATNQEKVLEFYNVRRTQLAKVEPNEGHRAIAELEQQYKVTVVTQNVDNLHERGGSTSVLHIHGELTKASSTIDPDLVYDIGPGLLNPGDLCEKGSQLRPHVVWFGEEIFHTEQACAAIADCDIVIVAGTSLQVYPAAAMILHAPPAARRYLVDPGSPNAPEDFQHLCGSVDILLPKLAKEFLAK
ncbi:SIR2 family NAD-dependent protein deacylase [Desulfosediminicola ganghwensis]|uniref:SIR2 family NAD-dependent protein deacylase n=1 Tax=Desulfosediminicola ganghwensis TaxID=2569540 RepID=UPI0010AB8765|nr:Sir2 family NAD-dependent protein deacetylase [Desulfosediminicola ganghwensis]